LIDAFSGCKRCVELRDEGATVSDLRSKVGHHGGSGEPKAREENAEESAHQPSRRARWGLERQVGRPRKQGHGVPVTQAVGVEEQVRAVEAPERTHEQNASTSAL